MRQPFALALLVVCISAGAVLSTKGDEDGSTSVYDRVFSTEELIEPSETLALLQELDGIYSKKPALFARRKKVVFLLEASKIIPGKCYYKKSVVSFLKLVDEYKAIKASNIVKYLEHFRDQQLDICEQLLAKYLKEEVARLSDDERKNIDMLRNNIVEANDGLDFEDSSMEIPREAVEEGARNFLEQQVPEGSDSEDRNLIFGYAFERLVLQLCGWTKRGAESMLEIIDLLAQDKQKAALAVDRFTIKWITNVRMCRLIAG